MEYSFELKIPKDRIAVVIGTKGAKKKELEKLTHSKLEIDSEEGDIKITGNDALNIYSLRELIRAIGRGFNPDTAQLLLKQDYVLEVISLNDFSREKSQQLRLKGRVIGQDGKSRRTIEELTDCFICVYGKTISIIGNAETISYAKRAVNLLLKGSTHSAVYKWLEKQRRELKRRRIDESFMIKQE